MKNVHTTTFGKHDRLRCHNLHNRRFYVHVVQIYRSLLNRFSRQRETEKNDPWEILSSFSDIRFSFNNSSTRRVQYLIFFSASELSKLLRLWYNRLTIAFLDVAKKMNKRLRMRRISTDRLIDALLPTMIIVLRSRRQFDRINHNLALITQCPGNTVKQYPSLLDRPSKVSN